LRHYFSTLQQNLDPQMLNPLRLKFFVSYNYFVSKFPTSPSTIMSHCLVCTQPENPDVTFCQSCGTKLLLRERYRAVLQIGQGGFGKTFLAVDQDLPNKPACAIKQFSPQIQGASGLQKATELFEQEAVQLNILGKHPQIPELLAHFEQDGRLYLVQEYVKGQNLAEELAQDGAFNEVKIRELLVG